MVKVERSYPAPKSLAIESQKKNGSYSESDVIERLKSDFHNKCYICELNDLSDPQVEHLHPHFGGRYPERKFDWNNLFWVCNHCNSVKNQRKYDDNIIDCCKEDPENLIYFRLQNGETVVTAQNSDDVKAVYTAELVTEVFNLKNTGMRVHTSDYRFQKLNMEMNKLYDTLEELKEFPDSKFALKKLKALLRKESKFAAFKRCYIRENVPEYCMYLL